MDELQHNDNPIWTGTAGEKHADAQIGGVLCRSELEPALGVFSPLKASPLTP